MKTKGIATVLVMAIGGFAIWGVTGLGGSTNSDSSVAAPVAVPVAVSDSGETGVRQSDAELLSEELFLGILSGNRIKFPTTLEKIDENWDISYVPMLLEAGRFLPASRRRDVFEVLQERTGQNFSGDLDRWLQWSWKQDFQPHPGYARFKSVLYSSIDPRFPEYFAHPENAKIRLDEIRWGGVIRDGIPPLKNPEMLAAKDADYLADTDVVFGIDLNGDARAYPKRILAWHEMFKDTIGGESVCGVY